MQSGLHGPVPTGLKPGIADFIPRKTIAVNRIVIATPSRPQLAIQGARVLLGLPSGHALATMNGPLYSNKNVGTNDPTVPAQFVLTFTKTHARFRSLQLTSRTWMSSATTSSRRYGSRAAEHPPSNSIPASV